MRSSKDEVVGKLSFFGGGRKRLARKAKVEQMSQVECSFSGTSGVSAEPPTLGGKPQAIVPRFALEQLDRCNSEERGNDWENTVRAKTPEEPLFSKPVAEILQTKAGKRSLSRYGESDDGDEPEQEGQAERQILSLQEGGLAEIQRNPFTENLLLDQLRNQPPQGLPHGLSTFGAGGNFQTPPMTTKIESAAPERGFNSTNVSPCFRASPGADEIGKGYELQSKFNMKAISPSVFHEGPLGKENYYPKSQNVSPHSRVRNLKAPSPNPFCIKASQAPKSQAQSPSAKPSKKRNLLKFQSQLPLEERLAKPTGPEVKVPERKRMKISELSTNEVLEKLSNISLDDRSVPKPPVEQKRVKLNFGQMNPRAPAPKKEIPRPRLTPRPSMSPSSGAASRPPPVPATQQRTRVPIKSTKLGGGQRPTWVGAGGVASHQKQKPSSPKRPFENHIFKARPVPKSTYEQPVKLHDQLMARHAENHRKKLKANSEIESIRSIGLRSLEGSLRSYDSCSQGGGDGGKFDFPENPGHEPNDPQKIQPSFQFHSSEKNGVAVPKIEILPELTSLEFQKFDVGRMQEEAPKVEQGLIEFIDQKKNSLHSRR